MNTLIILVALGLIFLGAGTPRFLHRPRRNRRLNSAARAAVLNGNLH